ncbi:MAG TPA: DUF4304 domain-containing protein [Saprospiraceae bacterium]|jgi:hypothetical protein|nr:DUF4304 domain-containing protein [Saprospiraceae bacterium]
MLFGRKNKINISETYSEIIKDIKSYLKEMGFESKGNTLRCNSFDNVVFISFQKSKSSNNQEISFTINCGICSKVIHEYQGRNGGNINLEDCQWIKRVGFFTPENKDLWFVVNGNNSIDSNEIKLILSTYVLPELFTLSKDIELLRTWENNINTRVTEFNRLLYITILNKHYFPENFSSSMKILEDFAQKNSINLKSFF